MWLASGIEIAGVMAVSSLVMTVSFSDCGSCSGFGASCTSFLGSIGAGAGAGVGGLIFGAAFCGVILAEVIFRFAGGRSCEK